MTAIISPSPRRNVAEYGGVRDPARGESPDSALITDSLRRLVASPGPTPSALKVHAGNVEERLFDAVSAAKMLTAQVAMHLDREWRKHLFRQLDALHDTESWDHSEDPVSAASFRTFLRTVLLLKPYRRPGLGLADRGHLVGAWTEGKDRLTVEFLPSDELRWVLVRYLDDERESAAGTTHVSRLGAVLAPYDPDRWLAARPHER